MTDDELNADAAEVYRHFEPARPVSERRRLLVDWAISLVCWDELMPIGVMAIAACVLFVFPNGVWLGFVIHITVPVGAFVVRLVVGRKHLHERALHTLQFCLFLLADFYLIHILFHATYLIDMLVNQDFPSPNEWIRLGQLYLIYLAAMALALFPLQALWQARKACQLTSPQSLDSR